MVGTRESAVACRAEEEEEEEVQVMVGTREGGGSSLQGRRGGGGGVGAGGRGIRLEGEAGRRAGLARWVLKREGCLGSRGEACPPAPPPAPEREGADALNSPL